MRLGLKTAPQIRTTTPRRRVKFLLTDIGASFERRCCSVAVNWDVLLNLLVSGKAPAKSNYYFCRSADPPTAGDVGAHRPASTQKLSHPPQPLREEKQKPADAGLFYQAQARRDDATLGLPTAFPSLGVTPVTSIYDVTGAASGFGNAGPALPLQADTPCHW